MSVALLLAAVLCGGAASDESKSFAEISITNLPDRAGACARFLDISYHIHNGEHPGETAITDGVDLDLPGAWVLLDDPRYRQGAYEVQGSKYTCYAASLTSIWRAQGYTVNQSQFVDAAEHSCGRGVTRAQTFLQIVNAANVVATHRPLDYVQISAPAIDGFFVKGILLSGHLRQRPATENHLTGGLSWYGPSSAFVTIDLKHAISDLIDPLLTRPMPSLAASQSAINDTIRNSTINFFAPVPWNLEKGQGMWPIIGPDQLVKAFAEKDGLLMGLRGEEGHTVVITSLKFIPSGLVSKTGGQRNIDPTLDARILDIQVLDPATPERPERWLGLPPDHIFDAVQFILAFKMS